MKLLITGEICKDTFRDVFNALELCAESGEPLELVISSDGGYLYDAVGIYDLIKASKVEVSVYAYGEICSSAFVVLLSGSKRQCSDNTRFMAHFCKFGNDDERSDMQEIAIEEGKEINSIMLDIIVNNTKRTKEYWNKEMKYKDFWFGKKRAIEMGVITE
jgi:ATP-dependent Clp protease protease subunit